MTGDRANAGTSGRVLWSASALLVLALAAQITIGGPVAAELVRQEVAAERAAVRRWSNTMARAIRELVHGTEQSDQKPGAIRMATTTLVRTIGSIELVDTGVKLSPWLHDLPPPMRA